MSDNKPIDEQPEVRRVTGTVFPADNFELAEAIAQAALATPGVHSMGKGRRPDVSAQGTRRKYRGVVVTASEVSIHIVAEAPKGLPIPDLAERVRRRVEPIVSGGSINVVVEDIVGRHRLYRRILPRFSLLTRVVRKLRR